mgnify:CR=1 FL=1
MRQNTVCAAVALSVIAAFGGRAADIAALEGSPLRWHGDTRHPAYAAFGQPLLKMDVDKFGGLAVKHVAAGSEVVFVSLTNGCMGHHKLSPEETARTRKAETQEAKRRFGLKDYIVLDSNDCALQVTYENRIAVAKLIREFQPDFVITHRTCDYHADHRAVGQAVMDASYLLGVPRWCEDVPRPDRLPAVLLLRDIFTTPREIRPDVVVDATPYVDRWCDAIAHHVSQFVEWLPFDRGIEGDVPDWNDVPARRAFLMKYWGDARKGFDAKRFGAKTPYVEVFEISQYGREPTAEDLKWFES